jgi:hypothetical protein
VTREQKWIALGTLGIVLVGALQGMPLGVVVAVVALHAVGQLVLAFVLDAAELLVDEYRVRRGR